MNTITVQSYFEGEASGGEVLFYGAAFGAGLVGPGGGAAGAASTLFARFPTSPSQLRHLFSGGPGKFIDTPSNRSLISSIANNPMYRLGSDQYGNFWSARTLPNGSQLYVRSYNGTILSAGYNNVPRAFNPTTGLAR